MPTKEELQTSLTNTQNFIKSLTSKSGELTAELREHNVVLSTLEKLPSGRKSFRLIGGVLVEKTVEEISINLTDSVGRLKTAIENIQKNIDEKTVELKNIQGQMNKLTTN